MAANPFGARYSPFCAIYLWHKTAKIFDVSQETAVSEAIRDILCAGDCLASFATDVKAVTVAMIIR